MSKNIKITVHIATNKVGSECINIIEVDRKEWESMSDDDKEDYCKEIAFDNVSWSYWPTKEDDYET